MIRTKCTIIIFVLAVLVFGCSQKLNTANQKLDVKDRIDLLLNEQFKNGKLNGNVLVVRNGKTLYERSLGYADASKSVPLNKDFRFNIGSVFKEFPAVAIMQLEEKELLKLDDTIDKYLPELPVWSKQITIKHLLQYSSGLPRIRWDEYFGKNQNVSDEILMRDLLDIKELEFHPGSDYLYSNFNPIILTKIVEKITNQQFNDHVKEQLLIPFGLKGTIIKEQYPYKDKTLMAIPFDSELKEDDYKTSVSSILFSSTTWDMYQWFEHLDSFDIVSKQSIKILSETAKTGDNIQAPLGLVKWENDKVTEHSHHGASASYECVVRRFKQKEITIIILTNQKHGNVYDLSDEILEIVNNS